MKYACNIICTSIIKDPKTGKVIQIRGRIDRERKNKVKGHLTWVAEARAWEVEAALKLHTNQ